MLDLEAAGMCGRLPEVSPWCKFEGNAWTDPNGQGRNGWEEVPYWLKGYGDLGYVLKDQRIIDDTKRWIDAIIDPAQTRDILIMALDVATRRRDAEALQLGVFQV